MPLAKNDAVEYAACEIAHAICDLFTLERSTHELEAFLARNKERFKRAIRLRGFTEKLLEEQDRLCRVPKGHPKSRIWFLLVDVITAELNRCV